MSDKRAFMSNRQTSIPLQSKVFLALVLLTATFVLVSYSILKSVIAPAFDDLEIDAARSDLHRAEAALWADIENLEAVTADWAPWDDIYYFVSGQNPGFRKSNLERPTLINLGLDMMAIHAADGRLVWSQLLVDGEEVPTGSLHVLNPDRAESAGLVEHDSVLDRTAGFVQTTQGPMIISSQPILLSDSSGPIAGAVVMAQFLNESRLVRLRERTGVDLAWETTDGRVEAGPIIDTEPTAIAASKILSDIHGAQILVLRTQTPRNISSLGSQTIDAAMLFMIVAGVLVCGFIWFTLRHTILRPIEQLSKHIDEIRDSGDLSRPLAMNRGDEIGDLGRQFDGMTGELSDARRALLDQSFKAGKADTAAEVMHNIRNALTPMINGLDRLRKSFKVSGNLRIAEAAQQLTDPDCPPERKEKLLEYISASFKHIKSVGDDALEDLSVVTAQAKQVEGILFDQQKFANVAPVAENVVMDELLGEAANVIPKEKPQTIELALDDDLASLRVRAHRIGLLQVMGNLILNAYESIKRSGTTGGKISLEAANEIVDEKPMVRVTIRDNGSGFDKDTELHIFRRGFTSKTKADSNGLGLHWCANAVAGMGGKISAESAGEGHGAEFHVLLPAARGG